MKPDDCTLTPQELARVRREAERCLRAAGALGRVPTPVADVMDAVRVTVDPGNVLDERFLARARHKAAQASGVLKRALGKVLGLFDPKEGLVFIDRAVRAVRQTFLKLHEAGHAFLPWQRPLYNLVEDSEHTLSSEVRSLFDREANVFASEVLFQLDTFTEEAAGYEFGILTPVNLSKGYKASIYATIRRYVWTNSRTCAVLVLDTPVFADGCGFIATLRRVITSPGFEQQFGRLNWPAQFTPDDEIGAMVPIGGRRMSSPRGMILADRNGCRHQCVAEAFTQTHQVFVLIHSAGIITRTTVVLP